MRSLCLAALVALCASAPVWPITPDTGPAHLVADLSPGFAPLVPISTEPFQSFTAVDGRVVFLASLEDEGDRCSLWTTDGTAAGTSRLAGLCDVPGEGDGPGIWATTGSVAFFTDLSGRLWSTDGTPGATFPLGGVKLGGGFAGVDRPLLGPDGRTLFFEGCTEAFGCEPWRSDGTPEGTVMLGDLRRGPEGSNPSAFSVDGHRVLFAAAEAVWATDGSPRGTVQVFAASNVLLLRPHGPEIFFETSGGVWVFDKRSRKTRQILRHGVEGHTGVFLTEAGGRVLLVPFDQEVPVLALWATDGTRVGTRRLGPRFTGGLDEIASVGKRVVFAAATQESFTELDLWFLDPEMRAPERFAGCPGGCPTLAPTPRYLGRAPLLAPFKGHLVFAGRDPQHGTELWSTDGTPQGTRLLKDLCPGECDGSPLGFRIFENRLLFLDAQRNLWATDGTAAGTVRLAPLTPLNSPPLPFPVDAAVLDGGRIVFNGFDAQGGPQPWVSDLTPAGTAPLAQIGSNLAAGTDFRAPTALGSRIVFPILNGDAFSLWTSDGTAAGTVRLPPTDASPDVPCFGCPGWTRLGGLVFFSAGEQLFRSDGTPDGTREILDLGAGERVGETGTLGDRLLFAAGESELWTSDGTAAGTRKLLSVPCGDLPESFMALGGRTLFFCAFSLWRTDGTAAGTLPIRDGISAPLFGTRGTLFHGRLFFLAKDPQGKTDLWQSDGTAAGTDLLVPEAASPRPALPSAPFVFRDALYFLDGELDQPVLWRSDGTAAGTHPFELPLNSNGGPLRLSGLPVPVGEHLFFAAADGVHGRELWKTDGMAAGTVLVRDIAPGPADSRPQSLTAAGDRLYFTADDGEHGRELWTSDGTAGGTAMVQDVLPGPASSWPQYLVAADGKLFFTANDGEHGRELWVLPLEPQP